MSQLMISGVIDGPLPGGLPKAIQLFALENISDLSAYALDAEAADGGPFVFPKVAVAAGHVIYVSVEGVGFAEYFGFAPDYIVAGFDSNANGVVELSRSGSIVDAFADMNPADPDRLLAGVQQVAFRAETARCLPSRSGWRPVTSSPAAEKRAATSGPCVAPVSTTRRPPGARCRAAPAAIAR